MPLVPLPEHANRRRDPPGLDHELGELFLVNEIQMNEHGGVVVVMRGGEERWVPRGEQGFLLAQVTHQHQGTLGFGA